jgi:glyoxylase-like metal-dependent hydrolase (beta-lactamase superfamily II)
MLIETFKVGPLFTNCYILTCKKTRESIIIDPGFDSKIEANKIIKTINSNNLELTLILNTHGHPDHTCGNGLIKDSFDVPILIHRFDSQMIGGATMENTLLFGLKNPSPKPDILIVDGNTIKFGVIKLKVIHTPGHTRGSVSLLSDKEFFSGDTLFSGSIGRTDLPGSSRYDMEKSLKKIVSLPEYLLVYPGHGPETNIGLEKDTNPFLRILNL